MCHVAAIARFAIPVFIFSLFLNSAPQARADLIGSTVTVHGEAPARGQIATNTATAIVGPQIEFPNGSFYSISDPLYAIPLTMDIQASDILLTVNADGYTIPGSFNGYIFDFTNLGTPILNAYLDPSSSYTTAQVKIGFSSNQVTLANQT